MSQLRDAVFRLQDRKKAVVAERLPVGGLCEAGHDELRRIISGYDLSLDEVLLVAGLTGDKAGRAIASETIAPSQALAGLWIDALMTGLLLADIRAECAREARGAERA